MTGIEPVFEKGYPCWDAVNRGATMADTNQLEMKIHELNEKIGKLNHEVETLKNVLNNLCERLMVQG